MKHPLIISLKRFFPVFLVMLLFGIHLPFLNADADLQLTHSRAAWTDEGLYTLQIRNWLNGFGFHITEVDAFLRSPLLSFYLLPFYAALGIHLWVGRIAVLLLCAIITWRLLKVNFLQDYTWVFIICLLTQWQFFHHTHLGLAEAPATLLTILALALFQNELKTQRITFYPSLLACLAAGFKVSFLFAPVLLFIMQIAFLSKQEVKKSIWIYGIAVAAFVFIWYLPNRIFIHQIISVQTEFGSDNAWQRIQWNYTWYFNNMYFRPHFILFWMNTIGCVALGIFYRKFKIEKNEIAILLFTLLWLAFECSKFANNYFPERYLVNAIAVNLLFFFQLINVLTHKLSFRIYTSYAFVIITTTWTLPTLWQSYRNRTFVMHEIDKELGASLQPNKPVMGNWAASCCWESKVPLKTLAHPIHNNIATLETHKPQLIITEPDEADSDKLFERQNISLQEIADSVAEKQVAHWVLRFYYLN